MKFLAKYKFQWIILLVLFFLYFVLRLPNLTLQPIFADEAIYIRWAQVMKSEPTLRFLPQTDGKTPLFMWILMPLLKFIQDPLLAGRFLSVISGFFTLLGVFFLTKLVFNEKTAIWASLLYIVTPYTVFFDRMALVDSMLSAFTIWVVYLALLLVKNPRLDLSMILGYLMGGAILTKTPGLINLLILPFSIILVKRKEKILIKMLLFWIIAIIIALALYNILRLGPEFHKLSQRNADYVFSPLELAGRPLDPFIPHLRDISDWFPKLFTWPILSLVIIGIFSIFSPFNRLSFLMFFWALVPLIISMTFLKTFTARYLLISIPLFLVIAGAGIIKLQSFFSFLKIPLIVLLILPLPLYFNYFLLTNPQLAPLPKMERNGYFENWTAGYGLSEIANLLIEKSKTEQVVVYTEGFFGTFPDGLFIYLDKANIPVIGSNAAVSEEMRKMAKEKSVFFVGNKKSLRGVLINDKLIKEFPKAKSKDNDLQDATILYQILPN